MKATLLSVERIWNAAPHNAFPSLLKYGELWLCALREGDAHAAGSDGTVRVLYSKDTKSWKSLAHLHLEGVDLRDPKISHMPDGRLMLLAGGGLRDASATYTRLDSYIAYSSDASTWSDWKQVCKPGQWLWEITWCKGHAYGMSYRFTDILDRSKEWELALHSSADGENFVEKTQLNVPEYPSEASLVYQKPSTLCALVRRETSAWLGRSKAPYREWIWADLGQHIGGPHLMCLPDGRLLAAGRQLVGGGEIPKTALFLIEDNSLTPLLSLPSGGDTSYPSLMWDKNSLLMAYYSSHNEGTAIYLARITID